MHLLGDAPHMVRGIAAILVFAVVYGALTLALGVAEARGIAAKLRLR